MERILVSACLLGRPVRWNGEGKTLPHPALERWEREGRLVVVCPELEGGFAVPRPPAEIVGGDGGDVLDGRARVVEPSGADVSTEFVAGARRALDAARAAGCRYALLTEKSPSCGSAGIYDGTFSGRQVDGRGVTAALLESHGIRVFGESGIDRLAVLVAGAAE